MRRWRHVAGGAIVEASPGHGCPTCRSGRRSLPPAPLGACARARTGSENRPTTGGRETLDAAALGQVIGEYRDALRSHQEVINRLNVFPVPDGEDIEPVDNLLM